MKFLAVLSCAIAAAQCAAVLPYAGFPYALGYHAAPVVTPGLPYLGPLTDGAVLHAGPKVELKALELPKIADHESLYPYFHNLGFGHVGYPYFLNAPAAAEE